LLCGGHAPNGWRYWRWGGRESAWEQRKLEARKMLENAAESPASSARFVGQPPRLPKRRLKKDSTTNTPNFYKQL
jgi:hypothetical protein